MPDKIFVLGSNSFSGSSFIDCALQEGFEILGISRSPEPNHVFLPYMWRSKDKPERFQFCQLDLNKDLDSIIELIRRFSPDYIVNFAAQSMVGESWKHPEDWMMTNVVSTVKFHEEIRKCEFLRKYIHISTPEVYGTCEGLIKESINYFPSTPYAVSRAAADMSLMTFFKTYGFPVTFTRASNVFGPGQQLYRIIPRAILFFLTGKKLQLHGGGNSFRSFIHIRDVSDGTLRVARQAKPGEIFHFATEKNISIRSLVEMIARMLGVSFQDNVEIVGERPGKDAAYLLDSTKAKSELGWKDKVSLEKGIEETIAWVRDNLEELKNLPFDYTHKP